MRYAESPTPERLKTQKYFQPIYQDRKIRLYFNKNPKNLKLSAPQKKTCLPGEGKDREKDPRSHTPGCCLNGAWFHNCFG
jgi:hypothetical protein